MYFTIPSESGTCHRAQGDAHAGHHPRSKDKRSGTRATRRDVMCCVGAARRYLTALNHYENEIPKFALKIEIFGRIHFPYGVRKV